MLNMSGGGRKIRGSLMRKSLGTDVIMFNFQVEVLLKDLYVRKTQLLELRLPVSKIGCVTY